MKTVLAAALVFCGLTVTAHADDNRRCGNVPLADWMSETDLRSKLAPLDIQIRVIDIDDGCYEVEALNKDGREVEISFHPQTGEQIWIDAD